MQAIFQFPKIFLFAQFLENLSYKTQKNMIFKYSKLFNFLLEKNKQLKSKHENKASLKVRQQKL